MADGKGYLTFTTSIRSENIWKTLAPATLSYRVVVLPKEYYINEKKKTIVLKWDDDTITKVKTSKDDKFDAKYGFLVAYFQKNCGMSKTKANKYLDNLEEEKNKKI